MREEQYNLEDAILRSLDKNKDVYVCLKMLRDAYGYNSPMQELFLGISGAGTPKDKFEKFININNLEYRMAARAGAICVWRKNKVNHPQEGSK